MIQLPCIDVYPPQDFKIKSESNVFKAIFLDETIWGTNSKGAITITFGTNGCDGCTQYGAWSYIGNQSNYFSQRGQPSMNLGFCDPPFESFSIDGKTLTPPSSATRNYCQGEKCWDNWVPGATVLHEFGHALGMLHEHQSNVQGDNPLVLDKESIYDYYNRIGLGDQAAETNVIDRYECTSQDCPYSGSPFDLKSIMLYAIPDDWVEGENPTYPNFVYSEDDKKWLEMKYPTSRPRDQWPQISIKFLDGADWQKYWVKYCIVNWLAPLIGINFIFDLPTEQPLTPNPTVRPTTMAPTVRPTTYPPTMAPTQGPIATYPPTMAPTIRPTTMAPTIRPTTMAPVYEPPTQSPVTMIPTVPPVTQLPTGPPITSQPTYEPTMSPTVGPTVTASPTYSPTEPPTRPPTVEISWEKITISLGYPRPQGNLSSFSWGLTRDAQIYFEKEYNSILMN